MHVAFLMTDGFDEREFRAPYEQLRAAGADTLVVGPVAGRVLGGKVGRDHVTVDVAAGDVDPRGLDGVVVPGGHSPDRLRILAPAVDLVARVHANGGLVAAICHGPWLLIEAGIVHGRTLTGWASVRTDVINAGGHWVDQQVARDGNLITSRRPDDVPAFTAAILAHLAQAS